MNTLPLETSAQLVTVNKSAMGSLISAAKASPLKTGLVVVGVTAVIAGSVYGVRKYRTIKNAKAAAHEAHEAAAAAATAATAEHEVKEAAETVNNKDRNKTAATAK